MAADILKGEKLDVFCGGTQLALRGSASDPLAGLIFDTMDAVGIAGYNFDSGNPDWLPSPLPAKAPVAAVQLLLDTGANLAGKTQIDELTYSLMGETGRYGTPVNFNASGHFPPGSSSCSAAAISGGLVDFAIGTDCDGSVRTTASFCGIYGYRPSHGRIALDGCIPLAPSFDVFGWVARDAATLARVGEVLLKEAPRAMRPKQLLIAEDTFAAVGPEVRSALSPALAKVRSSVGVEKSAMIAGKGLQACLQTFRTLQGTEIWASHGNWLTSTKPNIGLGILEYFAWAETVSGSEMNEAIKYREMFAERIHNMLADGSVLVLPTAPGIAPEQGASGEKFDDFCERTLCLIATAGLAGLPQISLPFAKLDGYPLGLSLVGRRGSDMELLTLAEDLSAES